MKKKLSTALAATAALMAGMMSAPSTQQVAQQNLDNSTRVQQSTPVRSHAQQQTANHQHIASSASELANLYAPIGGMGGVLLG